MTIEHAIAAIERAELRAHPYPHVIVDALLDPADADALRDWFEHGADWWVQRRNFYEHDTCDNIEDCPLTAGDGALSRPARAALAAALSRRFGVDLDDADVTLGAHRMSPGQGIGIHNDDPHLGTESLRLLLVLRRGDYHDSAGGHFCMFSAHDMAALGAIVRPLHNAAVAFGLHGASYHAVNDIEDGVRYSLVYGFWTRASKPRPTPPLARRRRDPAELADLAGADEMLAALRAAGADQVAHSGAQLLDHLIGVAAYLVEWGAEPAVCRAGLFHSAYGSATMRRRLFSEHERDRVRALIGERAEHLVWLFSTIRFTEVYRVAGETDYQARRREDSETMRITADDVRDLNLIACANLCEQLPVEKLDPTEVYEWRSMLERMADRFPPRALTALQAVFAEQASI